MHISILQGLLATCKKTIIKTNVAYFFSTAMRIDDGGGGAIEGCSECVCL